MENMSQCTAPIQGHHTASGAAACPVCGNRGTYYSTPNYSQRPPGDVRSRGYSSGSKSPRPGWSPSSSSVTYTPAEIKALVPVRRQVEYRAQHEPDRRGVAHELSDLLEAAGVSVWFSEKDIVLGQPFLREIDRGLANSRTGIVLVTPALLKRVDSRGVSDKELSELLARDLLIPVVHNTTYAELRKVSPLLASRNGLDTADDTLAVVATKIAELVSVEDALGA